MKFKLIMVAFVTAAFFSSCKKEDKSKIATDYNHGSITILTDDSFKSVTEAIADAYMINYPETSVRIEVKKEDLGFLDLLKEKARLIVMSRELNKQEISEYERITELKFNPAKFAADAVVFVVPAGSSKETISMEEIKTKLQDGSRDLIFDGTNAGNLNFVAQKLKKKPSDLKFSIIEGNEGVIRSLSEHPGRIGVISLNTISRPYAKEAQELRSIVKILPITVAAGKTVTPTGDNLKNMSYPFTRVVYFLANESNFQIANGIMRFACTQLGQMVVEKEGLQPYNLYNREVQMR